MDAAKWVSQAKTAASIVSLVTVASSLVGSHALSQVLRSLFSPKAHPARFAALIVALCLNAKSMPLIWHIRFFKAFVFQVYLRSKPLPRDALFRPIITASMYTPTNETDFNGHKSNSTYFADLDVARSQHIACLLAHGIRRANAGTHPEVKLKGDITVVREEADGAVPQKNTKAAVYAIALGAVSCHFKREIKPYQRFDIWTRVLSWDNKWIYQVSHIVKAGAAPPDYFSLQARQAPLNNPHQLSAQDWSDEQKSEFKDAIFATSISKYVVKRGRQTVPPEIVLQNSFLLPPKPDEPPNENSNRRHPAGAGIPDTWTWEGVEAERVRGMKVAEHFAALDALQDEFPISGFKSKNGLEVLGEYRDVFM